MAFTPIPLSNNPDNVSYNSPNFLDNAELFALQDNDSVLVGGSIDNAILNLDGGNDLLTFLAALSSGSLRIDRTTVNGGEGKDQVKVFAEVGDDFQINLDAGNDFAQLSSDPSAVEWVTMVSPGSDIVYRKPVGDDRAEYTNTRIYGGDADPTDGDQGPVNTGVDVVVVDNTVKSFNQSLIDLGDNSSGTLAPLVDDINDFIFFRSNFLNDLFDDNFDDINGNPGYEVLANLGIELALIQCDEFFQSSVRGNDGNDVILFDSFNLLNFNSYSGFLENINPLQEPWNAEVGTAGSGDIDFDFLISDEAITESLVNGNKGSDVVAILRDVDKSRIFGGEDNDVLLQLGASARFSRFNGNKGADTVLDYNLLSQNVTNSGGQGDDTIQAGAIEVTNSLYSGDKGNDKVNFIAVQSTNTSLKGGEGDDELDDNSGLLRNLGNVLDGGEGNDLLRQNAGIILEQILQFGATFIGGEGADVMIGDYAPGTLFGVDSAANEIVQTQITNGFRVSITDGKGLEEVACTKAESEIDPDGFATADGEYAKYELFGASSDLFKFDYGDSVITASGFGRDRIVEFDSDASLYSTGDATNVFTYKSYWKELDDLERDIIDLSPDAQVGANPGTNYNIKYGNSQFNSSGKGFNTNSQGRVINWNTSETLNSFIATAALSTVQGAAFIWEQYDAPFPNTQQQSNGEFDYQFGQTPVTSQLFISDGVAGLGPNDLLIQLDNVGGFEENLGGLVITNGNITNITVA